MLMGMGGGVALRGMVGALLTEQTVAFRVRVKKSAYKESR